MENKTARFTVLIDPQGREKALEANLAKLKANIGAFIDSASKH